MKKTRILAILAALAAAAAFAMLLAGRRPAPQAAGPSPALSGTADFAVTGSYADDWQAHCAPLTGQAQADCTSRLDARYGKADAAPVPVPVPNAAGH